MTLLVFLEIVGMALVGALGGVAIFEILRRIQNRRTTPRPHSEAHNSAANKGKIAIPTA